MVTSSDASPVAHAASVTVSPGGAESNVALHLHEGGCRSMWISQLGEDPLGTRILDALASRGVDTRYVTRASEANTGIYIKDPTPQGSRVYYYRKGSAASLLGPDAAADWPLEEAELVHMSGITLALSDSCRELVFEVMRRVAASEGTLMSFDVNYRPALWGVAEAARVTREAGQRADVVLVGLDEAGVLWGVRTAEEVAALFPRARYVVVKDGAREAVEFARGEGTEADRAAGGGGCSGGGAGRSGEGPGGVAGSSGDPGSSGAGADGEVVTRVPAWQVDVVEPVGAGDAFAGGYLSGLLRGKPAVERLELGHSMAAWVMGCAEDNRSGHGPEVRR